MNDENKMGTEVYLNKLTSGIINGISKIQYSFLEISRSFFLINEKGLYKIKYNTFQEYINQNFKINYQTVCKMINVFKYFLINKPSKINNIITFDYKNCPFISHDPNNKIDFCTKSNEYCSSQKKISSCYMVSNFSYTKLVPFLSLIKNNMIDDKKKEEIYQDSFILSKTEMEKKAKEIKKSFEENTSEENNNSTILDINKQKTINILKESIKNILYNYLITLQYIKFHPDFPKDIQIIEKILGNYFERKGISFFIPDWSIKIKPNKKKKVNSDYKLISDYSNLYYKNKKRGGIPYEFYESDKKNLHFTLLKNEILYILSKSDISQLDYFLNFYINQYIEKRFLSMNFLDTRDDNYTAAILNEQNLAVFNIICFYFNFKLNNIQIINIYSGKLCLKEYNYYKKMIYDTFCSEKFKDYLPKEDETEDNINNTDKK